MTGNGHGGAAHAGRPRIFVTGPNLLVDPALGRLAPRDFDTESIEALVHHPDVCAKDLSLALMEVVAELGRLRAPAPSPAACSAAATSSCAHTTARFEESSLESG